MTLLGVSNLQNQSVKNTTGFNSSYFDEQLLDLLYSSLLTY